MNEIECFLCLVVPIILLVIKVFNYKGEHK